MDEQRQFSRDTIINRRDALLRERRQIREERQKLALRDRMIDRELADCRAAARLFNLTDIDFPLDEQEEYFRFKATMEDAVLQHARVFSRHESKKSQPTLLLDIPTQKNTPPVTGKPAMPRIKDIVLDLLKSAGGKGLKAAAIRRYIENTYATQIHYKTVGMTLYRLSQEEGNPVCREGQLWFLSALKSKKSEGAPSSEGVFA